MFMKRLLFIGLLSLNFTSRLTAEEKVQGFTDWLWDDQVKPTVAAAGEPGSLWIFLGTAIGTSIAHHNDEEFRDRYGDNRGLSQKESRYGAILGSGLPGILIAAGQLYYDPENGLQHARALGFTALTHITIAESVQRKRPNGKSLSFPSGHTSSSFATATSLTYSYGPIAGIPAFAVASYIGFSRLANNSHWLSDTIAGAGLGIFWARASAQVTPKDKSLSFEPLYERGPDGPHYGLNFRTSW